MKSKLFLFLFLTVFTLNVYAHGSASAIYGGTYNLFAVTMKKMGQIYPFEMHAK